MRLSADFTIKDEDMDEHSSNFACPKCKAILSPNDFSEKVYSVLEVTDDYFIVRCNQCGSTMKVHLNPVEGG